MARTQDEDVGEHGDWKITTVLRRSNRGRTQKRFTARSPLRFAIVEPSTLSEYIAKHRRSKQNVIDLVAQARRRR
jgi:hypothetical protein